MQANLSSQSPLLSVRLGLLLAAVVLGLGLAAGVVANAHANTLCVNPGGTGGCYSKIQLAVNAASPGDTIIVAAGTYTENVTIGISVTVNGAGSGLTFVDGNNAGSVFTINPGVTVTITNMTIRDGYAAQGGGVYCLGKLTLTSVNIINNTAVYDGGGVYERTLGPVMSLNSSTGYNNTAGLGGGVYDYSSPFSMLNSTVGNNKAITGGGGGVLIAGGYVTVTNSTISGNTAQASGGGVYNGNNRTFTALNSTISFNVAQGNGGGVYNTTSSTFITLDSTISGNTAVSTTAVSGDGGGLYNDTYATMSFNNVTVANNHAGAAGQGGGVFNAGIPITTSNTIIGTNTAPTGSMDCSGPLNSQGYNLIQIPTGCVITGNLIGNILGPNPMLGPLANNGGPTWTQALLGGSPAINAGNPAPPGSGGFACLPTDQRGHARGATRCDMGAYEYP